MDVRKQDRLNRRANPKMWLAGAAGAALWFCAGCSKETPAPAADPAPAASSGNGADQLMSAVDRLPEQITKADSGQGATLKSVLKTHSADIEQIVEASRAGTFTFGIDYSGGPAVLLPHLAKLRSVARTLRADADRAIADGDLDAACKRAAALIRIGNRTVADGKTLIEWVTAVAIADTGCQLVKLNPQLAGAPWKTDIQTAIAEATPADPLGFRKVLANERTVLVTWIRAGKTAPGTEPKADISKMSAAQREASAKRLEDAFDRAIAALGSPDPSAKLAAIDQELSSGATLESVLWPAIARMHKSAASFGQTLRDTETLLKK